MRNVTAAVQALRTKFAGPLTAIETGTIRSYEERHESTRLISEALSDRGRLISIDCNPESIEISKLICRNAANVTWIQSDSVTFLKACHKNGIHFALLDSANQSGLIFQEFVLLAPRMIEGGILIVDDAGLTEDPEQIDRDSAGQKGHQVWRFLKSCDARRSVLPTSIRHHTQLRIDWTGQNRAKILAALTQHGLLD